MEICRNNKSKQYAVYLAEVDSAHFLAITPNSKVKELGLSLFGEPIAGDALNFVAEKMISEEQAKIFDQFNSYRKDDEVERYLLRFENLSSWGRQDFIARLQKRLKTEKDLQV